MSSNSFSITKEQSDAIEKMYHYKEILESLKEAIVICGNVTIGEAIDVMKKKRSTTSHRLVCLNCRN